MEAQNVNLNKIPNANEDGLNVGANVGNIDVLRNTNLGLFNSEKSKDKSTYTIETKPDGTTIETVKMDKSSNSRGIGNFGTNGVGVDGVSAKVGLGEKTSQDVVGFVDSIFGSKQAAGKLADVRQTEAETERAKVDNQIENNQVDQTELDEFRAMREAQLQQDALKRQQAQQQETINNGMSL